MTEKTRYPTPSQVVTAVATNALIADEEPKNTSPLHQTLDVDYACSRISTHTCRIILTNTHGSASPHQGESAVSTTLRQNTRRVVVVPTRSWHCATIDRRVCCLTVSCIAERATLRTKRLSEHTINSHGLHPWSRRPRNARNNPAFWSPTNDRIGQEGGCCRMCWPPGTAKRDAVRS